MFIKYLEKKCDERMTEYKLKNTINIHLIYIFDMFNISP